MSKRNFLVFFICLILIVGLISGCGQMQQPNNRKNNNANDTKGEQTRVVPRTVSPRRVVPSPAPGDNYRINNNMGDNNNTGNNTLRRDTNNEDYTNRVEDIAEEVARLKEVDSASCVITGNTALVGVQFSDQYKGGVTDRIKEKVEEVCREEDPEISRVVVTADPDILSRIEDMLDDIGNGRPVSGFAEEVNELINRIQPK